MRLREKTKQKLGKEGVGIVYFFGSRAFRVALDASDYDVGIVFLDSKKAYDEKTFVSIYDILSEDLADNIRGPKLDISFLQKANAYLEMSAVQGVVLFEADAPFRADYEESVLKRYDDYAHLNKDFEQATFYAFGLRALAH